MVTSPFDIADGIRDDVPAPAQGAAAPGVVVFLGPSLPLDVARATLPDADYRPPIRRGDLDAISGGTAVGIIDGVFAQTLSISPTEIREAIGRGVIVYGAASMGALRAAEVPGVIAVGRIAEMYRTGIIERDDEVALQFAPESYLALTDPLVNLRYGVERLVRSGSLRREAGDALIEAAAGLHFTERTLEAVLGRTPMAGSTDAPDLIRLLRSFDLKREDAHLLIETLATIDPAGLGSASGAALAPRAERDGATAGMQVRPSEAHDAPVLIWESGDLVGFPALMRFMMTTGSYEPAARRAAARMAASGRTVGAGGVIPDGPDAQSILDATRLVWGWESPEEAHVTLRDLGLGLQDLVLSLEAEATLQVRVAGLGTAGWPAFLRALRAELWLDDLTLKREALRCGAVDHFAALGRAGGPPELVEIDAARRTISRLRCAMQWPVVQSDLARQGLREEVLEAQVESLALARRAAAPVARMLDSPPSSRMPPTPRRDLWRGQGLGVAPSPKAEGSNRFALAPEAAEAAITQIAEGIGIVRIGLIGELDTLGVHVAQAFGARSGWSTSFSSGKSTTREGARVGAVMEEVEIFAQDVFRVANPVRTCYAAVRDDPAFVDPRRIGLPFDSRYDDLLEFEWTAASDLLGAGPVMVPTACLIGERVANDIYYSPRLGGKIFSSSGLGSGFSLAEAAVHAAAEFIERHAVRLAEIALDNPGGVGFGRFEFVDPDTLPDGPRGIARQYQDAGMMVRLLDITSEIAVPTFYARVFDDPFTSAASMSSDGFACHPDPEVAITMALLEAAQTKAGVIAGGREDYTLQARSLGRHERPRTMLPGAQAFWFANDRPMRAFDAAQGLRSGDILEELEWIADRVEGAGFPQFVICDFTTPRIRPAHAVRVLIPDAETTNPLYTGPRARATLIRDLLPRCVRPAP